MSNFCYRDGATEVSARTADAAKALVVEIHNPRHRARTTVRITWNAKGVARIVKAKT